MKKESERSPKKEGRTKDQNVDLETEETSEDQQERKKGTGIHAKTITGRSHYCQGRTGGSCEEAEKMG